MAKLNGDDIKLINEYSLSPNQLFVAISGLSESELDMSRAEGKWSIRQTVHHIVDCEMNYFQSNRYALCGTEHVFTIPFFDANQWAVQMKYGSRPIQLELRFFSLIREYIAYLCHILPDSLERTLKHENGEFTIRQALGHDIAHAKHHINQIVETRKGCPT